MSTDLYMHSVYYSMMLLEGTNYDSYFLVPMKGQIMTIIAHLDLLSKYRRWGYTNLYVYE